MDSLISFLSSDIGKLMAASSVIAALVTSIVNIFNIRATNKRVLEIETQKQNAELVTFRYTKLYEASLELGDVPGVIYDLENIQKLSDDINERYQRVKNIYRRVNPLLSINLSEKTREAEVKVQSIVNKATEAAYAGGESVSWKAVAERQQKFWEVFEDELSTNIKALTKPLI